MLFPPGYKAINVSKVVANLSALQQQRIKIQNSISSITSLSAPKSIPEGSPSFEIVAKPYLELKGRARGIKNGEKDLAQVLEKRIPSYFLSSLREHVSGLGGCKVRSMRLNRISPRSYAIFAEVDGAQYSVADFKVKTSGRNQGVFITSSEGKAKQFAITGFLHAKRHLLAEFDLAVEKAAGQA